MRARAGGCRGHGTARLTPRRSSQTHVYVSLMVPLVLLSPTRLDAPPLMLMSYMKHGAGVEGGASLRRRTAGASSAVGGTAADSAEMKPPRIIDDARGRRGCGAGHRGEGDARRGEEPDHLVGRQLGSMRVRGQLPRRLRVRSVRSGLKRVAGLHTHFLKSLETF